MSEKAEEFLANLAGMGVEEFRRKVKEATDDHPLTKIRLKHIEEIVPLAKEMNEIGEKLSRIVEERLGSEINQENSAERLRECEELSKRMRAMYDDITERRERFRKEWMEAVKSELTEKPQTKPGVLIHYGHSKFDLEEFRPIINDWEKPAGGFWTSPVGANRGWVHYLMGQLENGEELPKDYCHFKLKEWAKVFVIDSPQDLDKIAWKPYYEGIDFAGFRDYEALAKEYDALWLTENGYLTCKRHFPRGLMAWDCETVLIMNPDCIEQIKEGPV